MMVDIKKHKLELTWEEVWQPSSTRSPLHKERVMTVKVTNAHQPELGRCDQTCSYLTPPQPHSASAAVQPQGLPHIETIIVIKLRDRQSMHKSHCSGKDATKQLVKVD